MIKVLNKTPHRSIYHFHHGRRRSKYFGGDTKLFAQKYDLWVFILKLGKHIFLALAFSCEAFFSSKFLVQNWGAIQKKNNSKAVAD